MSYEGGFELDLGWIEYELSKLFRNKYAKMS